MEANECVGHSEDYFGDYRDFWWNQDFVALIAKRLRWQEAADVLDVGAGAGHWTRTIAKFLSRGTRITAMDNDPKWSSSNSKWVHSMTDQGFDVSIRSGSAEEIPFPEATFDFVTCQTVLIHLANPTAAIGQMLRVLKPGGLLLCVEPDNFGTISAATSLRDESSLEDEAATFKFQLAQARGRRALGHGDASFGGMLPSAFSEAGLSDIQVYLSDKAIPLYAPYANPQQRAVLSDTESWFTSSEDFSKERARSLFLAGLGNPAEFELMWTRELAGRENFLESLRTHTYHCAGGVLMYLVSGRKP